MSLHVLAKFFDNNGTIVAERTLKIDLARALPTIPRYLIPVGEWQQVTDAVRIMYAANPTACRVLLDIAGA